MKIWAILVVLITILVQPVNASAESADWKERNCVDRCIAELLRSSGKVLRGF